MCETAISESFLIRLSVHIAHANANASSKITPRRNDINDSALGGREELRPTEPYIYLT